MITHSITIKIKSIFKDPAKLLVIPLCVFGNLLPDKLFLSMKYRVGLGKKLNWDAPETLTEKIQWLKLYDRNPIYTNLVDKYAVKKYISDKIGSQYVIPLLGVYDSPDDIDFDSLPSQFVLKCTHDSGGIVICKDKQSFDREGAKHKLRKALRTNYYKKTREWPYKDVPRRIIAEKYMTDESGYELKDYKIFCFNGEPKIYRIYFDRFSNTPCAIAYDIEGNYIPFGSIGKASNSHKSIHIPETMPKMIELARILSKEIPFVRIDFYSIDGNIYFGEITLYPWSGWEKLYPEGWDKKLGDILYLPNQG